MARETSARRSTTSCGSLRGAWAKPGGRLADVVRSLIDVTDIAVADQAASASARHLKDARPAATLVQVKRLARPGQLVEIELDLVERRRAGRVADLFGETVRAALRALAGRPDGEPTDDDWLEQAEGELRKLEQDSCWNSRLHERTGGNYA